MLTSLTVIIIAYLFLAFVGVQILRKWNDFVPISIALIGLCFLGRYISIQNGTAKWIQFNYGVPFVFNEQMGLQALSYIGLGFYGIVLSYIYFRNQRKHELKFDDDQFFRYFLREKTSLIIGGLALSYVIAQLAGPQAFYLGAGGGSSYILYLPFMAASTIILGVLLIRDTYMAAPRKIIVLSLLLLNISTTFLSGARFVAIAWIGVVLVLIIKEISFKAKLFWGVPTIFLSVVSFLTLGLRRYRQIAELNLVDQFTLGFENLTKLGDFNMVDGMVMLLQVFPNYLDFYYGMGHIEILLRPIPRALWPDKPVGGWQQKLAVQRASEFYGSGADADLFGVGISPSLVGDFYSEGGLIAIIIFSILYGYALAKLMGLSTQYTSSQSGLIQGIIVASLFPILRGGDLPGIVAFIAMAYWPLFIFSFLYRRAIKKQIYYTKLEV